MLSNIVNSLYNTIVAPYQTLITKLVPNENGAHAFSSFLILLVLSIVTLGHHPLILLGISVGLAASKEIINFIHDEYGAGGDSVSFLPFLCSCMGGAGAILLVNFITTYLIK